MTNLKTPLNNVYDVPASHQVRRYPTLIVGIQ